MSEIQKATLEPEESLQFCESELKATLGCENRMIFKPKFPFSNARCEITAAFAEPKLLASLSCGRRIVFDRFRLSFELGRLHPVVAIAVRIVGDLA
jgi:hypothetical protein